MYTILIVEDEYLLRNELSLCVDWNGLGFETPYLAGDGEQGLIQAELCRPDVVLTDIRMPKMDGLTMIRRMREKGIGSICVVLSAYDDFTWAVDAMRSGVMDYLLKPIDDARLNEVLTAVAGRLRENRSQEAADSGPADDTAVNLYLQKADEYLEAHYAEDIRLSDVARSLFISDAYLGRLYIRCCQKKFSDVLNQLRIRKSIPLLRDAQDRIDQVAEMVGYRNQQYFGSIFKKCMGLTPYQFRHSLGIRGGDEP